MVVGVVPYGTRLSICVRRSMSVCSGVICIVVSSSSVLDGLGRFAALAYVIGRLLLCVCRVLHCCSFCTWSAICCTTLSISVFVSICVSCEKVGPLFQLLNVVFMFAILS